MVRQPELQGPKLAYNILEVTDTHGDHILVLECMGRKTVVLITFTVLSL